MNFNYFYNAGSLPFQHINHSMKQDNLLSFWNGNNFKSFLSYTDKVYSSVYSVATYPVDKFFYDSLNYSVNTIKEINQDLSYNPVSEKFSQNVSDSKFTLKKFIKIGLATIALQIGATALQHTNIDNEVVYPEYSSSLKVAYDTNLSTTPSLNTIKDSQKLSLFSQQNIQNEYSSFNNHSLPTYSFSQFLKNSVMNSNPVESIQQDISKEVIKLPQYMHSMFKTKEEATLHVLNVAEGQQNRFYRDNKGIAIAYGWNPTRNTKEFNLRIAQESGLNSEQTAAILKVSDTNKVNYVPKELKKIRLTQEQVNKTALALIPRYEEEFLQAMSFHAERNKRNVDHDIAAYHQLPNNQQAVLIHMAYKVGAENLMKYKTFYKKFFSYLDKPTKANLQQVQNNFTYTYATLQGERLHDTRVEEIHTGFFSQCAISSDSKTKEKIASKINQCRNIANLTNPDTVKDLKNNVATIQTKMAKMFG